MDGHVVVPTARRILARGNAPGIVLGIIAALKGRKNPTPFQGAQCSVDFETQGVAQGWHSAALTAPLRPGIGEGVFSVCVRIQNRHDFVAPAFWRALWNQADARPPRRTGAT